MICLYFVLSSTKCSKYLEQQYFVGKAHYEMNSCRTSAHYPFPLALHLSTLLICAKHLYCHNHYDYLFRLNDAACNNTALPSHHAPVNMIYHTNIHSDIHGPAMRIARIRFVCSRCQYCYRGSKGMRGLID